MRRTAMAAALVAMLAACQPAEAPQAPAGLAVTLGAGPAERSSSVRSPR